jgi:hypothetical protein
VIQCLEPKAGAVQMRVLRAFFGASSANLWVSFMLCPF